MSEEEQLVGTLIKIESHRQVEFIPNEYSRHVIDSEGLPVYAEPQPQLTIPKSIADEFDKFAHTNWANWQFYFYSDEMSKELIDWFDNGDSEFTNSKIAMVYLNPLTRDLVKVVADE